jgi:hypothetical protein
MIPRNETLGHRRHHRRPRAATSNHDNDVNDEEESHDSPHRQHRLREHNKNAFYAFMRKNFGKSGNTFVDACKIVESTGSLITVPTN